VIQKYLQSFNIPLPDYSIAASITSEESTYLLELSSMLNDIPVTISAKIMSGIA